MERLRSAHTQAERTLESRERSHRQRIRGLEEQVKFITILDPNFHLKWKI